MRAKIALKILNGLNLHCGNVGHMPEKSQVFLYHENQNSLTKILLSSLGFPYNRNSYTLSFIYDLENLSQESYDHCHCTSEMFCIKFIYLFSSNFCLVILEYGTIQCMTNMHTKSNQNQQSQVFGTVQVTCYPHGHEC